MDLGEDRKGIFDGSDPFVILRRWLEEAEKTEVNDANAMALATVDEAGLPDARIVLLKEIEEAAILFYTNYDSRKGQQLLATGKAAANLHWKSLRRQVRLRGSVSKVEPEKSDAYYHSRPLGSRVGAWVSQQSRPLASRDDLIRAVAEATERLGDNPKRPPNWGGFRLNPTEIEFWADGEFRLHDRFRWSRKQLTDEWRIDRLNP